MPAYYNEHDPHAAQWLRNLIAGGYIAPGIVDESDIRDIVPAQLLGYTQCHFFAGIGVWSLALRRAGWPDDRPIWTGSCPCQPFSAAGAGAGFADERHLWPAFNHLIDQCHPPVVVGEQVENAGAWLDLVSTDMEAKGYAFGAAFLPAAGFGGAHIRSRNYWVAHLPDNDGRGGKRGTQEGIGPDAEWRRGPASSGVTGGLANSPDGRRGIVGRALEPGDVRHVDGGGNASGRLVDGEQPRSIRSVRVLRFGRHPRRVLPIAAGSVAEAGGVSGMGHNQRPHAPMLGRNAADWLFCRDGRWRPVEPGTFPLVDAAPARVGRLRAYGNALDAETATGFIEAMMECI